MSWLPALVPFLLLASVLYLPGGVLARTFSRNWWLVVGIAPLLSTGVLGLAALLTGTGRLRWSISTVLAVSVVVVMVAVALRTALTRAGTHSVRLRDASGGQRGLLVLLLALFANALMVGLMYMRPTRDPHSIIQLYDTPFHLSVVRWILQSGDASPLHSAAVDGSATGSTFYPSLWHAWVALAEPVAGGSIPMAVNASLLVLLTMVWPISLGLLTRVLVGPGRLRTVAMSVAIASVFSSFPWLFLSFGVLYSNLFSYSLAPAFLALALLVFDPGASVRWPTRLPSLLGIGLGFMAFALAQPNSLFTVSVLLLPYLCVRLADVVGRGRQHSRTVGMVSVLVFCGVVTGLWQFVHDLPFMARTVSWQWPPFATVTSSVRAVLQLGMNRTPYQTLLAIVVLIGLVAVLRTPRRWLVVSYILIGSLYVLASSTSGWFRDLATGFWYHDSTRLSAALVIVLVPIAAIGLDLVVATLLPRGRVSEAVTTSVGAGLVFVLLVTSAMGPALVLRRTSFRIDSDGSTDRFVDAAEMTFMGDVERLVGGDAGIANNPYDGSAFGYSLLDMNMLFRSFPGNWISPLTTDHTTVTESLAKIGTSPTTICPAVHALGLEYVIHLSNNKGTLNYAPAAWEGIDAISDQTEGFELVLRDGELALYRITGCK